MEACDYPLKFQCKVIDHYMTFSYLLQYADERPPRLWEYAPGSSVYCPFHPNVSTKAAKLYGAEEGGGEKLYCFSESRMYRPHSLLSPPSIRDPIPSGGFYGIIPFTPFWVFNAIWRRLGVAERSEWVREGGVVAGSAGAGGILSDLYPLYRGGGIPLSTILRALAGRVEAKDGV